MSILLFSYMAAFNSIWFVNVVYIWKFLKLLYNYFYLVVVKLFVIIEVMMEWFMYFLVCILILVLIFYLENIVGLEMWGYPFSPWNKGYITLICCSMLVQFFWLYHWVIFVFEIPFIMMETDWNSWLLINKSSAQ